MHSALCIVTEATPSLTDGHHTEVLLKPFKEQIPFIQFAMSLKGLNDLATHKPPHSAAITRHHTQLQSHATTLNCKHTVACNRDKEAGESCLQEWYELVPESTEHKSSNPDKPTYECSMRVLCTSSSGLQSRTNICSPRCSQESADEIESRLSNCKSSNRTRRLSASSAALHSRVMMTQST